MVFTMAGTVTHSFSFVQPGFAIPRRKANE